MATPVMVDRRKGNGTHVMRAIVHEPIVSKVDVAYLTSFDP